MPLRRALALQIAAACLLGALPPAAAVCAAQQPGAVASAGGSANAQPGDVVRLRIWREPDMSGEFPVNEAGEVVLPRLGPVSVTAMSADSLKRRLVADYTTYLRDPSIEVTVLRRVSVSGAVRTPGVFTVEPTLTVADVLALAGGASPEGQRNRVEVMRAGTTVTRSVSRGTRIGDSPVRSGDQLVVPEKSWLSRNTALVTGIASSAVFLVATLINN